MNARLGVGRRTRVLFTVLVANLLGIAASHAQNSAPVISGSPPVSAVVNRGYDFRPGASDPDGDSLTFSVSNLPRWARFDRSTGRLYGTPWKRSIGTTRVITISVSDGRVTSSLPGFVIRVVARGTPWISGSPQTTGMEQELYGFLPDAGDPDGDRLTFSVANKPAWATFSGTSGLLSGIPPAGASGTYSNIQISASDGSTTVTLPAFSIAVASPTNRPPSITGTPATRGEAGQGYAFTPKASDPDADALRFSVQNLPRWAAFDEATGAISGTPAPTDVGTYGNIVVSVTDGEAFATLAPFTIEVTKAANGSASLSWQAPTVNQNGTPLTDLAGYRIVYGQSAGSLTQQVQIPDPGITSAAIENLAKGTWYFAVKAYNSANVQSDLSNIASKTIY